jgi:hypothetical protein
MGCGWRGRGGGGGGVSSGTATSTAMGYSGGASSAAFSLCASGTYGVPAAADMTRRTFVVAHVTVVVHPYIIMHASASQFPAQIAILSVRGPAASCGEGERGRRTNVWGTADVNHGPPRKGRTHTLYTVGMTHMQWYTPRSDGSRNAMKSKREQAVDATAGAGIMPWHCPLLLKSTAQRPPRACAWGGLQDWRVVHTLRSPVGTRGVRIVMARPTSGGGGQTNRHTKTSEQAHAY